MCESYLRLKVTMCIGLTFAPLLCRINVLPGTVSAGKSSNGKRPPALQLQPESGTRPRLTMESDPVTARQEGSTVDGSVGPSEIVSAAAHTTVAPGQRAA
jgi:hypothetical protein